MKAIIYSRVSTDKQDYTRQIQDITRLCEFEGIEIVKEFSEKISGKIKERNEIINMMNFIEANKSDIDFVFISELSRLGRNSDVAKLIEKLNDYKICLWSIKEGRSFDKDGNVNANMMLLFNLINSLNIFELDTIKFRVKSGLEKSKRAGNASGGAFLPFGYKKSSDKKLVIDENEYNIIKMIFELSFNGDGTKKIANKLNEMNIPTRTNIKWSDGVVYGILKNTLYKGYRKTKSADLPFNPDLQIIDEFIFDEIQKKLSDKYHKEGGIKKFDYLLDNQKVKCGCCGLNYYPHKRSSGKDNVYKCLSRRYTQNDYNCDNVGVNIDKLNAITNSVILYNFDDILTNSLNTDKLNDKLNVLKSDLLNYKLEQSNFEKKKAKLLDLYLDGDLEKTDYLSKSKKIENDIEKITEKINTIDNDINSIQTTIINKSDINKLRSDFYNNDLSLDKSTVNKIIDEIVVYKLNDSDLDIVNVLNKYDYFNNKQDKLFILTFKSGDVIYKYLTSQRSKNVYDYQKDCVYDIFTKIGFNYKFVGHRN